MKILYERRNVSFQVHTEQAISHGLGENQFAVHPGNGVIRTREPGRKHDWLRSTLNNPGDIGRRHLFRRYRIHVRGLNTRERQTVKER